MSAARLLVVTVAYGAEDVVVEHLATWARSMRHLSTSSARSRARVRVVDNGAGWELEQRLRDLDWGAASLEVLHRPDNPGFATSVGLASNDVAPDEHLVLLNPDVAVHDSFFETLVAFAAGPGRRNLGAIPLRTGGQVHAGVGIGALLHFRDRPRDRPGRLLLAGPSGGGAVIPGRTWHRLGGLWAPYFAWGEDADLALRAWQAGHSTEPVPVEARHLGGHTLTDRALRRRKARLLARNRVWYLARSARPSLVAVLALPWTAALTATIAKHVPRGTATATLAGIVDGLRGWGEASRSRPLGDKLAMGDWARLARATGGPR